MKKVASTPSQSDGLPYPRVNRYPHYFIKMTAKDVKEMSYMPQFTFFGVLERPGKTVDGVVTTLSG